MCGRYASTKSPEELSAMFDAANDIAAAAAPSRPGKDAPGSPDAPAAAGETPAGTAPAGTAPAGTAPERDAASGGSGAGEPARGAGNGGPGGGAAQGAVPTEALAPPWRPDYNVAPTKQVPAVVVRDGSRRLVRLRWGLIPSWAKDPSIGSRLTNARVETAASKPAFRAAWRSRRCLLPADGYYEWVPGTDPVTGTSVKQPYFLTRPDAAVLAMAGLYEFWTDADGQWWRTCTVLTTAAADDVGHIHDRTPLLVAPQHWADWLEPASGVDPATLVTPAVVGAIVATAVSRDVNSVRNNGPQLLTPLADTAVAR